MKQRTSFKLDEFLPFKLNTTAEIITRDFSEMCIAKFNLSRSQWRIMVLLEQHQLLTAKEICEMTNMEKVMVSRAVKELEQRKLIKRKVNKSDKRSLFLELTAKGKKSIEKLIPAVNDWQKNLKKNVGARNYNQLVSMLNEVKSKLPD